MTQVEVVSTTTAFVPPGIRLGVVRGISYGLFGPPDVFAGAARELGAGLIRAYLYWSQLEPQPGHYVWDTVDALLDQLDGDEEVWITLCSSSLWATRERADFQPPSPALDLNTYREFVRRTVAHCGRRVRYWQCNNEPSNTDLLWAGTAEEYLAHLAVMYEAVKAEDPGAAVVLGGCGYDVFSSEQGSQEREFFDHLVSAGRDCFDLFSVHLYGEVTAIPGYLDTARQLMLAHGYLKPIVVGEHAGPVPFEYPEVASVTHSRFWPTGSPSPHRPRPSTSSPGRPPSRHRSGARWPRCMRAGRSCRPRCRCSWPTARPSWRRSATGSTVGRW
jgi:hypothetical protein